MGYMTTKKRKAGVQAKEGAGLPEKVTVAGADLDWAMALAAKKGARYADLRIETGFSEAAVAENGEIKTLLLAEGTTVGVRALAGGTWGFRAADVDAPTAEALRKAVQRCVEGAVAAAKATSRRKFSAVQLAQAGTPVAKITPDVKKRPVSLDEKKRTVIEMSKDMKSVETIQMAITSIYHTDLTRHFASTEGARLTEDVLFVGGSVYAFGAAGSSMQTYWRPFGAKGGWEYIEAAEPMRLARSVAETTRLLVTTAVTPRSRVTTVVTRPAFNTLSVHEIVGHPVEADRVLGGESAWAGRAWWKDLVGQRVASPLVTAVSDARQTERHAGHYGTFRYDDEGVPAHRVVHLEQGVLRDFLHSRQTAAIMGVEPNGGMRAISAGVVPIIRMTNTYFEPDAGGPSTLEEMIEDIEDGIILGHQSIPSIDSRRYRWQISAYEGWEIRRGQIGRMLRNISLLGNTPDYLGSIYRVGNEKTFELHPVPNCGKGDPMQVQKVTNGGPLMAGKGRIVGGA